MPFELAIPTGKLKTNERDFHPRPNITKRNYNSHEYFLEIGMNLQLPKIKSVRVAQRSCTEFLNFELLKIEFELFYLFEPWSSQEGPSGKS